MGERARDIIAAYLKELDRPDPNATATAILFKLEEAGYRILSAAELHERDSELITLAIMGERKRHKERET